MSKQTKTVSIKGFLYFSKPPYSDDSAGAYSFSSWELRPEYLFDLTPIKELVIEIEVPVDSLEMS